MSGDRIEGNTLTDSLGKYVAEGNINPLFFYYYQLLFQPCSYLLHLKMPTAFETVVNSYWCSLFNMITWENKPCEK